MTHPSKRRYIRVISLRLLQYYLPANNTEEEIEWLCECLGLTDERDKLAKEIFKELVKASKEDNGITTYQIKEKVHVTQGAVVYHINTFIRSGMVIKEGRYYYLRAPTLSDTLSEMEQYMLRRMELLRKIARELEDSMQ